MKISYEIGSGMVSFAKCIHAALLTIYGSVISSGEIEKEIMSNFIMDKDIIGIYAVFGCMISLLLPLWNSKYRSFLTALSCCFTGALIGGALGPAIYEYLDKAYIAMGVSGVLCLLGPWFISNPSASVSTIIKLWKEFKSKK